MIKKHLLILFLIIVSITGLAQFYNGHQMNFGKNRVQYDEFEWFFFRFQRFDTYFTVGNADVALQTAKVANNETSKLEKLFDHVLSKRIVFIIYDNLTDFRQSNIGLETDTGEGNIGGVTRVIDNVVFLYIEGDQRSLETQVKAAIANVILNEMLYGTGLRDKIANNALIALPDWYINGLVAYVSEGWNPETENYVKAGMNSGRYDKINHLIGEDAKHAGHSIWNYIAKSYGEQVIPTIVYLTRVTKSIENGFLYVLGTPLGMLQSNWQAYYLSDFERFLAITNQPEGRKVLKKSRKDFKYYNPAVCNNRVNIAWVDNIMGRYRIRLHNLETGKTKTLLRREHKLEQITDFSYPLINWHPSGQLLGFIIDKEGDTYYQTYNIETEEFSEIKIAALDKVSSFNYSHDGFLLTLSAFNNGQSDIFIFNIAANTLDNITQDIADDYNPVFIRNSNQILFTSNRDGEVIGSRNNSRIPLQKNTDIFVCDIKTKEIEQISKTPLINETQANLLEDKYIWLSDANGVYNMYNGYIDSAVKYIDTITHYRYFLNQRAITNYQYNILSYNMADKSQANVKMYYDDNGYNILYNESLPDGSTEPVVTNARNVYISQQDYLSAKESDIKETVDEEEDISLSDSIITKAEEVYVDINNYSFDLPEKESFSGNSEFDDEGFAIEPNTNRYFTTFYTNYLVSQVDFGFLMNTYQPFTGSAFYFNPGFNVILKVGTSDLFEDYRITGGVRFAGNFDSNEYLLSFENLRKRWNKQLIFHRHGMMSLYNNKFVKTHTHHVYYITRYPFSQVDAVQFTTSLRSDRLAFLTMDYESMLAPNLYNYWASIKAEYIFDNTRQLNINILDGFRMKVFGEAYMQLNRKETELFVFGADFRYYQPIHRNLIFAARFAASGSFGRAKLVYYLGGIDNWINLSSQTPTFDESIRIDPEANYVYQAVATNMRGFSQNIRNGTNFALINAEIRWPFVSYLFNKPVNNDFIQNLQLNLFLDVGSAWSGLNPFGGNNAYENDIYDNHPVTVIIHNNNYPIVTGYGFGLRTRLFGYFIRADWAWGIENNIQLPRIFYLSLSLDF
jgi:hypothetical protein